MDRRHRCGSNPPAEPEVVAVNSSNAGVSELVDMAPFEGTCVTSHWTGLSVKSIAPEDPIHAGLTEILIA